MNSNLLDKRSKLLRVAVNLAVLDIIVALSFYSAYAHLAVVLIVIWLNWRSLLRLIFFGYEKCVHCRKLKKRCQFVDKTLSSFPVCHTCMGSNTSLGVIHDAYRGILDLVDLQLAEQKLHLQAEAHRKDPAFQERAKAIGDDEHPVAIVTIPETKGDPP